MSRPKLYGICGSRAFRSVWAMEETGVDYEHIPTHFVEESKTPDYLAINPNGRIPCLVDGDLTLFESMAINLYAAKTYGGALYPDNPADEARVQQWSVWAISEIEPHQMQIVIQKFFTPEDKRNPAIIERAAESLQRPLKVLDDHLSKRPYLLGDDFTVADLNVAAVMQIMKTVQVDISAYRNVTAWLEKCYARPSYERARTKDDRPLMPD